jgi:hypothetical protein
MDLNPKVLRNLVETLCSSEGQIALEKTTKSVYSYASAKDTNCVQLFQTEGIIEGLTRIIVLEVSVDKEGGVVECLVTHNIAPH